MPFVSLGSRRRIEVVLDHDKQRLTNEMRAKDNATTSAHFGHAPGRSGYLYANHPLTKGPVRGPPAPFMKSNKPWNPEELDPSSPHAQKNAEQAPIGAFIEGSHSMIAETLRKSRSLPAVERTLRGTAHTSFKLSANAEDGKSIGDQAKEAANPVSIELNRWKRLADVTHRDLSSMPELHSWIKPERQKPKAFASKGGLVNFPKYMLFENSHMKMLDLQKFSDDQKKAQEAAERGELRTPVGLQDEDEEDEDEDIYRSASWGQPRLRNATNPNKMWAGSGMPAGRSMKSSNPFRN
jgi:hypothetical protein